MSQNKSYFVMEENHKTILFVYFLRLQNFIKNIFGGKWGSIMHQLRADN